MAYEIKISPEEIDDIEVQLNTALSYFNTAQYCWESGFTTAYNYYNNGLPDSTSKTNLLNFLNYCIYNQDKLNSGGRLKRIGIMLDNVRSNLEAISTSITIFQQEWKEKISSSATEVGLNIDVNEMIQNNRLVITTDVEMDLDGDGTLETYTINLSEVLNAYVSTNEVLINGEIANRVMVGESLIEGFSYADYVGKTRALVAKSIELNLYSTDFINAIKDISTDKLEEKILPTEIGGYISSGRIKDYLDVGAMVLDGTVSAAGLVGLGVLGSGVAFTSATPSVTSPSPDTNSTSEQSPGSSPSQNTTGGESPKPSVGNNSNGGENPKPSGDNNSNNGESPKPSDENGSNNDNKEQEDKNSEEDKKDDDNKEPKNDVEIPDIVEDPKLPETVESDIEIDYDELAREKFEFETDYETIMADRVKLADEINTMFESGDTEGLTKMLKDSGYNSAEAQVILQSKELTTKAILEGNQKQQLAEIAKELAGDENYPSKYLDRPNYEDLISDNNSKELTLASNNQEVVDNYKEMVDARDKYDETVKIANDAITEVTDSKKAMEDIKTKYEKEFGEDTTQWSKEAATEYKEAITKYNDSVTKANESMENVKTAKETYEKEANEFRTLKNNYYENEGKNDSTGDPSQGFGSKPTDGENSNENPSENPETPVEPLKPGEKPTFDFDIIPDLEGVTIDGVAAKDIDPYNPPGLSQEELINMGAAMMRSNESILNTIREDDDQLIQE